MLHEYEVITAKRKLSEKVNEGTRGTVLLILNFEQALYEVEFVDHAGDFLDLITCKDADIELEKNT